MGKNPQVPFTKNPWDGGAFTLAIRFFIAGEDARLAGNCANRRSILLGGLS
jgi:hypothetical protein